MKMFFKGFFYACCLTLLIQHVNATTKAGFFLPDSVPEFTLQYKSLDNLIVLPVVINDSVTVNLILDTGCRNVLLFGRRFKKLMTLEPNRVVKFSGMGQGKSVEGSLSLENKVSIGAVSGSLVPVVVVPSRPLFYSHLQIDGLIGYDIFTRFEVEVNPAKHLITFRSAFNNYIPESYTKIPMTVNDSRPMLSSKIVLGNETIESDLLIDTGSMLGLLLKSTDKSRYGLKLGDQLIGKGLNGMIKGVKVVSRKLSLGNDFEITDLDTGIIHSPWHNYASVGMDVLKDYSIILNYVQSYVCLKKA